MKELAALMTSVENDPTAGHRQFGICAVQLTDEPFRGSQISALIR